MEEATIDYGAVIYQLQLENESLRQHVKTFTEMQEMVYTIPRLLETLWHKVTSNKMQMLIGLMVIYWIATIIFMLVDRLHIWRWP